MKVLLLAAFILVILIMYKQLFKTEYFNTRLYKNVVVPQGNQLPLKSTVVSDVSIGPTLDGTCNTPNDMFMFSRNQCRPECCPSTYSCDKGCICTTEQQRRFIGETRGNNKTVLEYDQI